MVVWPAAQRPTKKPILFLDGKIIDAGVPDPREARRVELPILIAVRPIPLTGRVVRLVGKSHSDSVLREGPQLLDKPVVPFCSPLPCKKSDDFLAPMDELGSVSPIAVQRVSARNPFRVPRVPIIFNCADFQNGCLSREWRHEARHWLRRCAHFSSFLLLCLVPHVGCGSAYGSR